MIGKIAVTAIVLLAAACAGATTKVMAPPDAAVRSRAIMIMHGENTVEVPVEHVVYFQRRLERALYKKGGFERGAGLILEYRFVQLDPGSRFARFVPGPSGKGTLTVEVRFYDDVATELARIETGGEILGGLFGGSFKDALDKAAQEAADYAVANFRG
jgi:hypothetical protein